MAKFSHLDPDDPASKTALGVARCQGANGRGEHCGSPAESGSHLCRWHGSRLPSNVAFNERKRLEREAQKLLGEWQADPTPVGNPIEALARLAGQAESLKDFAYRATQPKGECLCCGAEEGVDPAAFIAFNHVAKNLTTMLSAMDKMNLNERMIDLESQRVHITILAIIAALKAVKPDIDYLQMEQAKSVFLTSLTELMSKPPEVTGPVWVN